MSEDDKGFVIKDRRIFATDDEDSRKEDPEEKASPEPESEAGPEPGPETKSREEEDWIPPIPEITFATFVFSLSSSVLLHLGEMPDPTTNETEVNLPLAKQTIDILAMLSNKTTGNLDEEEDNLLKNLLYELRMKYVALSK